MSTELKPCPFCGGNADYWVDKWGDGLHVIECRDCGCCKRSNIGMDGVEQIWNTRADGWISVDDNMPLSIDDFSHCSKPVIMSLTKDVIVTNGEEVWVAEFMMWVDNQVSGHIFTCLGTPTHWMPLPSPPRTK